MTEPSHVDGNAVGAILADVFGTDVTNHRGCCDHCGKVSRMGTLVVFRRAPGDVLRCPACGTVLIVIVETPHGIRVGWGSLRWVEFPGG